MPADVHSGVGAVTLPLQGGARAAEFILRLQLNPTVLRQLWEPSERYTRLLILVIWQKCRTESYEVGTIQKETEKEMEEMDVWEKLCVAKGGA